MYQQIDSLSSLQLYAVIVGVTTVIAMTLLEAGGPSPPETTPLHSESNVASVSSSPNHATTTSWTNKATISSKDRIKVAEPQWYIFKWVNVVAVTLFLAVVVHLFVVQPYSHKGYHGAISDESILTWSPLVQFLMAWSVFVCYCFGFFGVSLVHDLMQQHRPAEVPKVQPQEEPSHLVSSSEPYEVPDPTR
jgi:hypothetical protein